MKKLCFLTCLCLLCALPAQAQKKKKNLPIEARVNVPNCVWIDTLGLFADQTEVVNIHWKEYCAWIQKYEPAKYVACLSDTTVWFNFADEFSIHSNYSNYFSYSGFRFFPVVGITKQQAEEYAQWRSKRVTEAYNQQQNDLAQKYHVEITYRLPAEKEWIVLAQGGGNNPHGFKNPTKREKHVLTKQYTYKGVVERANCKMPYDSTRQVPHSGGTLFRGTEYMLWYLPNDYQLYNTIGNAAEMVQEEGIAKGGSWFHTLEESAIKERQTYTKPTAWLGFRCVATVKLTPKKIEK